MARALSKVTQPGAKTTAAQVAAAKKAAASATAAYNETKRRAALHAKKATKKVTKKPTKKGKLSIPHLSGSSSYSLGASASTVIVLSSG